MTTEQIIEQKLADFKAQLLKELTPKQEFEVGKWYIATSGSFKDYLIKFLKHEESYIVSKEWFTPALNDYVIQEGFFDSIQRPATKEEIQTALVKEAEKRGFKEGVEYKSMISPFTYKYKGNLKYIADEDKLVDNGECTIYHQGKFAEIITEPKIMIGGKYEVKFERSNCSIAFNFLARIDGHIFGGHFWEAALRVAEHTKASVYVGCDAKTSGQHKWSVDKETITKILNECKKPVH